MTMVSARKGITLIEIVIALAIVVFIAALVMPRLPRRATSERDALRYELATLLQTAYVQALTTHNVQRILFKIADARVELQQLKAGQDVHKESSFEPVRLSYVVTAFSWDPVYQLVNFVVKGREEVTHAEGISTKTTWFYISPSGLAQEVRITFRHKERGDAFTLQINPFTLQVQVAREE